MVVIRRGWMLVLRGMGPGGRERKGFARLWPHIRRFGVIRFGFISVHIWVMGWWGWGIAHRFGWWGRWGSYMGVVWPGWWVMNYFWSSPGSFRMKWAGPRWKKWINIFKLERERVSTSTSSCPVNSVFGICIFKIFWVIN